MKKIIVLCLLVILVAPLGFSQVFVGGSASVSYSYTASWPVFQSISVGVNPVLGYRFGIFGAGVSFNFSQTFSLDWDRDSSPPFYRFGVFGELRLFTIGNFSLLGRGSAFYSISSWGEFHQLEFTGSGIIEYPISDRLSVFSVLGNLSFRPALLDRTHYDFWANLQFGGLGLRFFF